MRHQSRQRKLQHQHYGGNGKNQHDNFGKYAQHRSHLPANRHIQKNAENIQRQERNNYRHNHMVYNIPKILHGTFQAAAVNYRHSQPQGKC